MGLARATAGEGDQLTVHALRDERGGAPVRRDDRLTVVADLPVPRPIRERSLRWGVDRSRMLLERRSRRVSMVRPAGFDVAHIHLLNLMTDSWSLGALGRIVPLVSTVHDVRPHHRRLPDGLERRLLAQTYQRAGTMVVYHEYLRAQLIEHFDVPAECVRVIPHPIREFRPGPLDRDGATPTILMFGALRRNKGVGVLLRAIEQLGSEDIRFHIAGRGAADIEAQVREGARSLPKLSADICFIPDAKRESLYHEADLVVLPYTSFESQSGVLADAYSFGVPLVVTDVGALGDTVRDDATGWAVPPEDPTALATTLREALANETARRAARRHMARIAEDRSEAATGRAFRRLYNEITGL